MSRPRGRKARFVKVTLRVEVPADHDWYADTDPEFIGRMVRKAVDVNTDMDAWVIGTEEEAIGS
jgi:hypothetical protein